MDHSYPIPQIDDSLDPLAGTEWFSPLNLACGYWLVEMPEDAKEKTLFAMGSGGLFQFKVMSFRLPRRRLGDKWKECWLDFSGNLV